MGDNGVQAFIIKIHKEAEDVSNAEAIGVLEIIKLDLHQEILRNAKE